jgi:hypothetical protein
MQYDINEKWRRRNKDLSSNAGGSLSDDHRLFCAVPDAATIAIS